MRNSKVDPYLWRKQVNKNKIHILDRWVQGNRILDVGCGSGAYAKHLSNNGLIVFAIDIEDRISNKGGINFINTKVPPIPTKDNVCDTLILFDVLEHVDEEKIMKEVKRVTCQRLILSVPSDNNGFLPLYGLSHLHNVDKGHLREYNPDSIRTLMKSFGFHIVHIQPQYPDNIQFVLKELFKPTFIGFFLKKITLIWIKFLTRFNFIQVRVPADWFVIADLIPYKTKEEN